jgi:3-polyprenyl-4-hydroxybenzoate decarboxylase
MQGTGRIQEHISSALFTVIQPYSLETLVMVVQPCSLETLVVVATRGMYKAMLCMN